MPNMIPYNRQAALRYADQWAYRRNPAFLDYSELGGDCTNYASQCLLAGTGVMNTTWTLGWYYKNGNEKSPSWTGVPYFYNFMTRTDQSPGPFGIEVPMRSIEVGDFIQLKFKGKSAFGHTPIVVAIRYPIMERNIYVAAHSQDANWRPLDTYQYSEIRFIHIQGAYLPTAQTGTTLISSF